MHDQSDSRGDRGGSRDGRGEDREHQPRHDAGGPGRGGRGDTRFLQLEMSQVLYADAEEVTRPAFRELLREAAKDRLRERFGEEITTLAQLAVDELLNGMQASFEIEGRVQQHGEERRPPEERLRELFAAWRARGASRPAQAKRRERGMSRRGK